MALNKNINLKVFYSIKEVAEMFDVAESTLRYWESEFPTLKPKVAANKVRQYTDADIKMIRNIHNLVKVRGFKIASARKMLSKNPQDVDKSSEILSTLVSVREELNALKKTLETLR